MKKSKVELSQDEIVLIFNALDILRPDNSKAEKVRATLYGKFALLVLDFPEIKV